MAAAAGAPRSGGGGGGVRGAALPDAARQPVRPEVVWPRHRPVDPAMEAPVQVHRVASVRRAGGPFLWRGVRPSCHRNGTPRPTPRHAPAPATASAGPASLGTMPPEPKPLAVVGSINADLVLRVPRLPAAGETLAAASLDTFPGGKVGWGGWDGNASARGCRARPPPRPHSLMRPLTGPDATRAPCLLEAAGGRADPFPFPTRSTPNQPPHSPSHLAGRQPGRRCRTPRVAYPHAGTGRRRRCGRLHAGSTGGGGGGRGRRAPGCGSHRDGGHIAAAVR